MCANLGFTQDNGWHSPQKKLGVVADPVIKAIGSPKKVTSPLRIKLGPFAPKLI